MRKIFLALALLFTIQVKAQTRVLIGADVGSGFGALYAGPSIGIEMPIKRIELDVYDTYMPAYQHLSAGGNGWSNSVNGGPIVWATNSVGISGSVYDAIYNTKTVHKEQQFISGGVILRKSIQGMPIRFKWDYLQEINDGIGSNGTESSRLKGGSYEMDMLAGCHGAVCFRVDIAARIGRVLQQGNPVCDGTFGLTGGPNNGPCYRTASSAGSFGIKVLMLWPRPRGHETEPF